MTLKNGDFLKERYRILDVVQQNRQGALYRAVDEQLEISVFIREKSYNSQQPTGGLDLLQFQQEAKSLAAFRHPNLPRVLAFFILENGTRYLVTDYIEGKNLHQIMADDAGLTESEALHIGIVLCDVLEYMHSLRPAITPRVIKPANIKVTPGGEIFLVDFGEAEARSDTDFTQDSQAQDTPSQTTLTGVSDQTQDIFSLGATLYTILTGYAPEVATAEGNLIPGVRLTALTPIRSYQPAISRLTAQAIEKALCLNCEQPWHTVNDFKDALIRAYAALPSDAKSNPHLVPFETPALRFNTVYSEQEVHQPFTLRAITGWLKRLDPVWLLFSSIVIFLLAMIILSVNILPGIQGVLGWFQTDTFMETQTLADDASNLFVSPEQNFQPPPTITPQIQVACTPAAKNNNLSPSGATPLHQIAYVSESSGIPQIWLVDVNSRELIQLTEIAEGACQPHWSPDARQLVITSPCMTRRALYPGSGLLIVDIDSGKLTPLPASAEGDFDPAWSPDGLWIAYASLVDGRRQLFKINLQDLTKTRLSNGEYREFSPAWSPDGTQIAFVRIVNSGEIWLMDADGTNQEPVSLSTVDDYSNPAWAPDGDLILFSQALGSGSPSKQIYGLRLDDSDQPKEFPVRPSNTLDYIPLMDNADFSPDGLWLAFDYWFFDIQANIYIMTLCGEHLTQLTVDPGLDYDPVWAPLP